jgi:recombination protein RecA
MSQPAPRLRDIVAATRLRPRDEADASLPPWTRPNLAGRLVELSGGIDSAALTAAVSLVLDAQRRGETTAWVASRASSFVPPDVEASGVDLEALPVVRVPLPEHVTRAAERLVRCGAFDLVVIDVGKTSVPLPLVTRLLGLAEKHETAVVFLTEKTSAMPSISSLVSLRVEARRTRSDKIRAEPAFLVEIAALRDKRRPAGWTHAETFDGPPGVR